MAYLYINPFELDSHVLHNIRLKHQRRFHMSSDAQTIAPAVPRRIKTRSLPTLRAILALMLREMSTRYGKSPGGYLWALLEPAGAIAILSLAFSLVVRSPPLGSSFILFYATGYLPFMVYGSVTAVVARAIPYSRPLLMYPAVTWIDATLARFFLNALTGASITFIVILGILFGTNARIIIELPPILISQSLLLVVALGIGTLNAALFGLFPVWEMVWGIAMRPLMLASGVMFIYEDMPSFARSILWYNPLLHVTGEMRKGFYPMYDANYVSPVYVLSVGLLSLFFGIVLLGRYHRNILNNE